MNAKSKYDHFMGRFKCKRPVLRVDSGLSTDKSSIELRMSGQQDKFNGRLLGTFDKKVVDGKETFVADEFTAKLYLSMPTIEEFEIKETNLMNKKWKTEPVESETASTIEGHYCEDITLKGKYCGSILQSMYDPASLSFDGDIKGVSYEEIDDAVRSANHSSHLVHLLNELYLKNQRKKRA